MVAARSRIARRNPGLTGYADQRRHRNACATPAGAIRVASLGTVPPARPGGAAR